MNKRVKLQDIRDAVVVLTTTAEESDAQGHPDLGDAYRGAATVLTKLAVQHTESLMALRDLKLEVSLWEDRAREAKNRIDSLKAEVEQLKDAVRVLQRRKS